MRRIALRPLAEQAIVITGASSGIGLVTARLAAARGARVMLVARNEAALAQAVAGIEQAGGIAAYAVADVAERDAVEAAAAAAVRRFGRIDSWVNNAGVAIFGRLVDTPADEHRRMVATNYFGVVNGCLAAIPHLRHGGALITIASIGADLPSPVIGAYSATKHAVKAYVEALRMELHADGLPIAVTLVKPSGIDTPIGQHAANHGFGARRGEARVPPPVYAPELVADAILHAATHPRRDLTVGGAGRLNVLMGQHFPWLVDLLTPALARVAIDARQSPTRGDTLFASDDAGRARSGIETPRRTSLYTGAILHPRTTGALAAGALALAAAALMRARRHDRTAATLPPKEPAMTDDPVPPLPVQQQPMPGRTDAMDPRPDHGEDSYRGSGKLDRKAAIITGGDSGIGRAVAIAFAREGADLLISYLDEHDDAAETKRLVEAAGRKAVLMPGDITDAAHCRAIVDRAVAELGGLDILVNNAAHQASFEAIEGISDEEWQVTFATNIHAMFYLAKAAMPHLRAGSAIINTTSINADQPSAQLLAYATTKGAIQNFTMGLAQLLGKRGIRVNCVAPGPVWTPLIPSTMPPEKVKTFGQQTPLGRPAQPRELAPAYVLLASDEASYMSGATIAVTGGTPFL